MIFQKADIGEFDLIKEFYWDLIDEMKEQNDKIGWKKGIYPTDDLFIIIRMSKIYFDLHRLRLHLKQKKCNQM